MMVFTPLFCKSVNAHHGTITETGQPGNLVLIEIPVTESRRCVALFVKDSECSVHGILRNPDLTNTVVKEDLEFFTSRWWGWAWGIPTMF